MKRLWNGRSRLRTSTATGNRAEDSALRFLKRQGLRLVRRNYRCRFGEIDLIMQDRDCLVIVEVRYRTSASFTPPALTVDARKQRKIASAASAFLAASTTRGESPVRFDVVAIERGENGPGAIQWIKDAFRV